MAISKFSRPFIEVKLYLPFEDEAELLDSQSYQILLKEYLKVKQPEKTMVKGKTKVKNND